MPTIYRKSDGKPCKCDKSQLKQMMATKNFSLEPVEVEPEKPKAPEKAPDKAPDKTPDKTPDKEPDKTPKAPAAPAAPAAPKK